MDGEVYFMISITFDMFCNLMNNKISEEEGIMKKMVVLFSLVTIIIFICIRCDSVFSPKTADCVIVGNITETEDFSGDIKFLGEIKNQGEAKALFVNITFTLKDSSGNVIDTDFTYVSSTDLDPGQTSSFECYTNTKRTDVSSWTYEIDWDEED